MAFVGFAPAFSGAFRQGRQQQSQQQAQQQRGELQGRLQEQGAEQRLAELQKRFELQAQQPTSQQRLAESFATDPNVRNLLEFQADPLGQKQQSLDIQRQSLEARLAALGRGGEKQTNQAKNFQFLISQGLTPEQAREIAFRRSPFDGFLSQSLRGQNQGPSPLSID